MSTAGSAHGAPLTAGPALLDRAVSRTPLRRHDGRSGARLERVVLDDGTRLIVKRTSRAVDLVMRVTGSTVSREYVLWQAGVLDHLPPGVGHAVVDAWLEGADTVLAMRDLGDAVVGWGCRLSRNSFRRVWGAATRLHRAFGGATVEGLCPLRDRVSVFAPWRMTAEATGEDPLPRAVLCGWERFAEMVPGDVADPVLGMLAAPERLSDLLARRPGTLIHGDLWLVNVALERNHVTLLDWDLATWAPPALEFALFHDGNSSQVDASRDELVEDFRTEWGSDHDEVALRLALFAGLVDLGWNKALDVSEHPDAEVRVRERADLGWWVAQARRALELGLLG